MGYVGVFVCGFFAIAVLMSSFPHTLGFSAAGISSNTVTSSMVSTSAPVASGTAVAIMQSAEEIDIPGWAILAGEKIGRGYRSWQCNRTHWSQTKCFMYRAMPKIALAARTVANIVAWAVSFMARLANSFLIDIFVALWSGLSFAYSFTAELGVFRFARTVLMFLLKGFIFPVGISTILMDLKI